MAWVVFCLVSTQPVSGGVASRLGLHSSWGRHPGQAYHRRRL